MPGTPNTKSAKSPKAVGPVEPRALDFDLDSLLAAKSLEPATVGIAGIDFTVRRDFTAQEVVAYHALAAAGRNKDAFGMVVGDQADELIRFASPLPVEIWQPIIQQLLRIAGILPREGELGESAAS
jgi:hypothetical protein